MKGRSGGVAARRRTLGLVAVAALVVAVVAIVVAVWGAVSAWRSAKASERSADSASQSRGDQLGPSVRIDAQAIRERWHSGDYPGRGPPAVTEPRVTEYVSPSQDGVRALLGAYLAIRNEGASSATLMFDAFRVHPESSSLVPTRLGPSRKWGLTRSCLDYRLDTSGRIGTRSDAKCWVTVG